jgi:phosphatidylethanolamine/phosphatidyl-N-methylethanolamine N-methyltransferase
LAQLDRFKLQPDERLKFLQGFLRRPQQVGSVIPSSRYLERRVIERAGVQNAQMVVELGPGTGGTTRAILRALPKTGKLLCIELNPDFVRVLQRNPDPRLIVHEGGAQDLEEILESHGLPAPDTVISGIPFSTMSTALGRSIVETVRRVLAPGGRFVAYQVRGRVGDLGRAVFGPARVGLELRNLPPMRVYRWVKEERAA